MYANYQSNGKKWLMCDASSSTSYNVSVAIDNPTTRQQWYILPNGDGTYRIVSRNFSVSRCLAPENNGTADGTNIVLQSWTDADSQKWILESANEVIFERLDTLHQLAKEYDYFNDIRLVLQFIRRNRERYTNGFWPTVAGNIDEGFVSYVQTNNPSIYSFFTTPNIQIYDSQKGPIDFVHLCATMNGIVYDRMIGGQLPFDHYHFDNLCGWAGDLQTLVVDIYISTNASDDYTTFYNAFYQAIGRSQHSFPMDDLLADVDALNFANNWISSYWQSNLFGTACQYYYSNTNIPGTGWNSRANLRFSQFLSPQTKAEFTQSVLQYAEQYLLEEYEWIEWPLYESKAEEKGIVLDLTTNQSNAAANAFADYIWNQCQLE